MSELRGCTPPRGRRHPGRTGPAGAVPRSRGVLRPVRPDQGRLRQVSCPSGRDLRGPRRAPTAARAKSAAADPGRGMAPAGAGRTAFARSRRRRIAWAGASPSSATGRSGPMTRGFQLDRAVRRSPGGRRSAQVTGSTESVQPTILPSRGTRRQSRLARSHGIGARRGLRRGSVSAARRTAPAVPTAMPASTVPASTPAAPQPLRVDGDLETGPVVAVQLLPGACGGLGRVDGAQPAAAARGGRPRRTAVPRSRCAEASRLRMYAYPLRCSLPSRQTGLAAARARDREVPVGDPWRRGQRDRPAVGAGVRRACAAAGPVTAKYRARASSWASTPSSSVRRPFADELPLHPQLDSGSPSRTAGSTLVGKSLAPSRKTSRYSSPPIGSASMKYQQVVGEHERS